MSVQRWLDEVRKECGRQRLPRVYVERLVSELSDHLTELMEDSMSMEACENPQMALGSPVEISVAAISEYRKRQFAGRHPWLAFIIAPTLSLLVLWCVSLLSLIYSAKAIGFDSDNPTVTAQAAYWANELLPFVVVASLVVPIVVASIAFCRLAVKSAVSIRWVLACFLILAAIGGAANSSVLLPTPGNTGSVTFGFGFSVPPSPQQLAQFMLPIFIGGLMLYLSRRHVTGASLSSSVGE